MKAFLKTRAAVRGVEGSAEVTKRRPDEFTETLCVPRGRGESGVTGVS